jgi:folate-binding protein YgfZ
MTTDLNGAAPIHALGVLRAQGIDASSFLHNQLTNDLLLLPAPGARLAGFCNAKGRLQASFIVIKRASDDVLLVCSQDLLATTLKRLSMFMLRAKVKLSDANADFKLWGLAGPSLASITGGQMLSPWALREIPAGMVLGLYPSDNCPRALLLADASQPEPDLPTLSTQLWDWSDVRAGVATVSQPVYEAFVPQMLNYESVGGVNFKKGCYPGQEVVARSQFRGTLKRRAYLARCSQTLQAGQELFSAGDDQPCGTVVQAAQAPDGQFEAIVSVQISAFEASDVRLAGPQGPALSLQPAPYPLLADI